MKTSLGLVTLFLLALGTPGATEPKWEKATFGGGCFWCLEAVFEDLKGVKSVTSGYAGGTTANPTYEAVCSGTSGHAEVIQVEFDPQVLPYSELMKIFFSMHDPTTLNRQGADRGTQYRSIIFYSSPAHKQLSETARQVAQKDWQSPIVTEIVPLSKFYPAEEYHQGYFKQNVKKPYCSAVIAPKVEKLRKLYAPLLKK
jgi:peptide-methionine (S)-S-oxide reductase